MPTPTQTGRSLIAGNVPTFTVCVVQVGTWNEQDITPQEMFETQEGIENVTTSDKQRLQVTPTWMTITGQTPLTKGASVTDGGSRKWVVTEITSEFDAAGRKMYTGTWVYDETLSSLIS